MCKRNAVALLQMASLMAHQGIGSIVLLCGKAEEIFYDGEGRETERLMMDPEAGSYGCVVPAGSWHTIVALEPTVIMEVKDGRYGEDGSECR